MAAPEWTGFRCTFPKPNEDWRDRRTCHPLTDIYHVAHVPEACRIIEDRQVTAGLIGDESRLKRSRISVAWFSANTWANGSIYGNVQFRFRWEDLIQGKRVYWVEAIAYGNPAYRFLITDRNLSSSTLVTEYDPETDEGPLRLREGVWYWNAEKTSEFMVDRDIPLRMCTEISFIRHKPDSCSKHQSACKDRNRLFFNTGAQVLAYVLGRNLTSVRKCFRAPEAGDKVEAGNTIGPSLGTLLDDLSGAEISGRHRLPARTRAILRGSLLLLYGHGQIEDARRLVSLLESKAVLKTALERMVCNYMGMPEYSIVE